MRPKSPPVVCMHTTIQQACASRSNGTLHTNRVKWYGEWGKYRASSSKRHAYHTYTWYMNTTCCYPFSCYSFGAKYFQWKTSCLRLTDNSTKTAWYFYTDSLKRILSSLMTPRVVHFGFAGIRPVLAAALHPSLWSHRPLAWMPRKIIFK